MPVHRSFATRILWILSLFFLACSPLAALTLEELQSDPHLTPGGLMGYFSDFGFELHAEVQRPEVFLSRKRGDCDDFATLAALLLRQRGYTTRLIAVCMEKEVHVVCYVAETKSYLDYNYRRTRTLIPTTGALDNIAEKVAESFKTNWFSVSEFTFANGVRQFVETQFH